MAEERRELENWMRNVALMNDNDDKADIRDGIAETKGVRHRINTGYGNGLKMVSREENTKVFKMLKQLRGFMKREEVLKEEIAD